MSSWEGIMDETLKDWIQATTDIRIVLERLGHKYAVPEDDVSVAIDSVDDALGGLLYGAYAVGNASS